jgi:putative tryptophan/tyrosine transport system substrate-binding protein
MRRRDFVTLLGGAAVAAPLAVRAQQLNSYRIGYLGVSSSARQGTRFDAFRAGLAALDYVEGKNIVIEQRWLGDRPYDQLDTLARQLVDLKVDVIVTHATPGVLAVKRATTTIPIVMAAVGDAVETGLVSSLARPGGNVTGTTFFNPELSAKRTELLKEAIPGLAKAGLLYNPANPSNGPVLAAVNTTAQSLKLELEQFPVRAPTDLNGAFSAMAAKSVGAFVITEDPMLIYNVSTSATFALQHRLAGCGFSEFARAGGLVGYGVDFPELWRHAATFVDKILKGTKPANIPVEQPTKFETVVNLKTAKTIGVEVATSLLLRADEVIE